MSDTVSEQTTVNLEEFAQMAGFPLELVKKELMIEGDSSQKVSLDDLRAAMLNYLDSAMLE